MLATLGFAIVGVFFAAFGLTFERMVVRPTKLHLTEFAMANGIMALAFWVLAGVCYVNNITLMQVGAIVFDGLLLAATIAVLDVFLAMVPYRELWLIVSVGVSLYLMSDRITTYPPAPYLDNGLLVMNDATAVLVTFGVLLAAIWLPVSILMTREVTHEIRQNHHWPLFGVLYFASIILALVFAIVGRPEVAVGSFAAIVVCFASLFATNLHVAKEARTHPHHKSKAEHTPVHEHA